MKRIFTGIFLASVLFSLVLSCSKIDFTEIGSELIPAVDNINTFEMILPVDSDNILFDDTTQMFEEPHGIGILEDPEFGKTDAALYFTLEPIAFGTYPFLKKDTVYIDSLVLSLGYTQAYGDSSSIQHFEVREIDENAVFVKDSAYRISDEPFSVNSTVLGSKTVNFQSLDDSVFYNNYKDSVRTKNELRIHLDTNFARRFVNYDTASEFKNDSIFKERFKGLEIRANEAMSPVKRALAYFDINNTDRTKLTFYCRVVRNGVTDTINPVFRYSSDDPNANIIKRTPSAAYASAVNNGIDKDEVLYIQSSPGSYAKLNIPGLDTMTNKVIHLAELVVETLPTQEANFFTGPNILFLDALSDDNDSAFSIRYDFIPVQTAPFYDIGTLGGTLRNSKYSFNISRFVQGIVTRNEKNYTLRLHAPYIENLNYVGADGFISRYRPMYISTPVAKGRTVVGGGRHPEKPVRLRIIYSKI